MPNKRQEVLEIVLDKKGNLKPFSIMVDFENAVAEINAFKKYFPESQVRCCFFTLIRTCVLCIQIHSNTRLKNYYDDNDDVAVKLKLLCALAYVPPEKVITAFEKKNPEETQISSRLF